MSVLVARARSDASSEDMVDVVLSSAAVVPMYENPPWNPPASPVTPVDDASYRWYLALLSNKGAHVRKVGVLTLLLNADGVGMLTLLLYVGDGGQLARVLHAGDIGVLATLACCCASNSATL